MTEAYSAKYPARVAWAAALDEGRDGDDELRSHVQEWLTRDGPKTLSPGANHLVGAFHAMISRHDFPCVGAKAALARDQIEIAVAKDITSSWNDVEIYSKLRAFAQRYKAGPELFRSFAILFQGPLTLSEEEFETNLWARLQSLTNKDCWVGHPADSRVTNDPSDPHFSLSFGEEAFFVVGLHPKASRPARRFCAPAMVFNLHDQFEILRHSGRYEKLRESILARDEAIAGNINPMLTRYGEISEARQYSGRAVDEDWVCPFRGRELEWRDQNS